ncbi:MAG: hypothetical protein KDH96_09290 [Candidatus Riesia sp.]|nr:hypothetical protein [Candidatus Riesia sp.]
MIRFIAAIFSWSLSLSLIELASDLYVKHLKVFSLDQTRLTSSSVVTSLREKIGAIGLVVSQPDTTSLTTPRSGVSDVVGGVSSTNLLVYRVKGLVTS